MYNIRIHTYIHTYIYIYTYYTFMNNITYNTYDYMYGRIRIMQYSLDINTHRIYNKNYYYYCNVSPFTGFFRQRYKQFTSQSPIIYTACPTTFIKMYGDFSWISEIIRYVKHQYEQILLGKRRGFSSFQEEASFNSSTAYITSNWISVKLLRKTCVYVVKI